MKIKDFKQYQMNYLIQKTISIKDYFLFQHKLFSKSLDFINRHKVNNVIFPYVYDYNFDTRALADELIKNNINVYYLEILKNKILLNNIKTVFQPLISIKRKKYFKIKNYSSIPSNSVFIMPLCLIHNEKQAMIFDKNIYFFLKNIDCYKLGFFNKENNQSNLIEEQTIKFNKVLVI